MYRSVVLGVGCSFALAVTMQHFRLKERFRLLWRYCWNLDENVILYPFRLPSMLHEVNNDGGIVEKAVENIDDGIVRLLVTPTTAATSTMHASLIQIEKGRELPSFKAPAVEFYYVVSCSKTGTSFSQQGVVTTTELQVGDFFVVDVGSIRWISNRGGSSPLVILRITDGGYRYDYPRSTEAIRMDQALKKTQGKSTVLNRVSTMDHLWRQVTKYVSGSP